MVINHFKILCRSLERRNLIIVCKVVTALPSGMNDSDSENSGL